MNNIVKLATIVLLTMVSFAVKSQAQTFNETLKYINQKFVCCTKSTATYKGQSVQVTSQGLVTVTGFLKDENRVYNAKFDLLSLYTGKDGKYPIYTTGNHLSFDDKPAHAFTFVFKTVEEAESVKKAFIHLQTLCKKNRESFDN
ncbi:hypothetical protein FA048_13880 [Pedobacter polaris]|uniref:DUF4369 domain-containing protein n=1 Tax=Pedobacter polaris TaxID=2571273 RepID=A0A4U1CR67_9SPHI|nr:hypothetical protein [Pedobacter polaris]TKC08242.1 hypothetical protein FA048_13880 [Pedobacter polaris]